MRRVLVLLALSLVLVGCGEQAVQKAIEAVPEEVPVAEPAAEPAGEEAQPEVPEKPADAPDLSTLVTDDYCDKLVPSDVVATLKEVNNFDDFIIKSGYYPDLVPSAQARCDYSGHSGPTGPYDDPKGYTYPAFTIVFDCEIGYLGGPTAVEFVESKLFLGGEETMKIGDKASFQQKSGHAFIAKKGCYIQMSVPQRREWNDAQLQAAKDALLAVAPLIDANFP